MDTVNLGNPTSLCHGLGDAAGLTGRVSVFAQADGAVANVDTAGSGPDVPDVAADNTHGRVGGSVQRTPQNKRCNPSINPSSTSSKGRRPKFRLSLPTSPGRWRRNWACGKRTGGPSGCICFSFACGPMSNRSEAVRCGSFTTGCVPGLGLSKARRRSLWSRLSLGWQAKISRRTTIM